VWIRSRATTRAGSPRRCARSTPSSGTPNTMSRPAASRSRMKPDVPGRVVRRGRSRGGAQTDDRSSGRQAHRPSGALRPRGAARSPISGASLAATPGGRARTRNAHPVPLLGLACDAKGAWKRADHRYFVDAAQVGPPLNGRRNVAGVVQDGPGPCSFRTPSDCARAHRFPGTTVLCGYNLSMGMFQVDSFRKH